MREFAKQFYKSKQWQNCRLAYLKSVGGLCERCLAQGKYTVAEIVHHKKHITKKNIGNPNITLSFSNLEALCRECHGAEHQGDRKRFVVDEFGRVTILKDRE